MEEIFPILDGLKYGHDTIALLSIISPSSYRVLYRAPTDNYNPPTPTFTLESGMIGPPLNRKPDLDLRRAIFYEEATKALLNNKTRMYTSFIAAKIQANFHGRNLAASTTPINRAVEKLSDSTPDFNQLAIEYEVLSMIKDGPPAKNKICLQSEEVVYDYKTKKWHTILKPEPEPWSISRRKVPLSKKREDSRKRMIKYRASKLADKHSFRTISELNSSPSFRRELRSRSSSISKKQLIQSTGVRTPMTRSRGPKSPVKKTDN